MISIELNSFQILLKMPKQYQCQSCRQTFGKNKESYKKHIKRCRMPPTPKKPLTQAEERVLQIEEQINVIKAEYIEQNVIHEQAQQAQQPKQEKEVPWFHLPTEERLLRGLKQRQTPQTIQKIETFHNKNIKQLTSDICKKWSWGIERVGPYEFQKMLQHYPNQYNSMELYDKEIYLKNQKIFKEQSHQLSFQRRWYDQKCDQQIRQSLFPKRVAKQGEYPLRYLLDEEWRYTRHTKLNNDILFPEEHPQHRWGQFKTNIANYLATHRMIEYDLSLYHQIKELDFQQATSPTRYILNKTVQQWQYDRVKYLTSRNHPNPYWHCIRQKQTVIPMQKWLQLALYYQRTIQCAAGATFFTQTPFQCSERNGRRFEVTAKPLQSRNHPQKVLWQCSVCSIVFEILGGEYCAECAAHYCFTCSASIPRHGPRAIPGQHRRILPFDTELRNRIKSQEVPQKKKRIKKTFQERTDDLRRKSERKILNLRKKNAQCGQKDDKKDFLRQEWLLEHAIKQLQSQDLHSMEIDAIPEESEQSEQ